MNIKSATQFISRFAVSIFLAWSLILIAEFVLFGPSSYVKQHDNADGRLAARLSLADDIRSGDLSFRNGDLLGGVDLLAEGNSLDLTNLFFVVLPGWLAYAAVLFLQRFIAGYFTYKVLNSQLGVASVYALLPALSFAAFYQPQINNQFDGFTMYDSLGLPAIPLVIYVLVELISRRSTKPNLLVGLAILAGALFSLVSNFAFTLFLFPIVAAWLAIFIPRPDRKRAMLAWLAFSIGWLSFESLELVPSLIAAAESQRMLKNDCASPVTSFAVLLPALGEFLFNPVNALLMSLGFVGLVGGDGSFWRSKDLWIGGLAIGLLIVGFYGGSLVCNQYFPINLAKGFNFSRFNLYFPFCMAIFAGLGLEAFVSSPRNWVVRLSHPGKISGALVVGGVILLTGLIWTVKELNLHSRIQGHNYVNFYANPYLEHVANLLGQEEKKYRTAFIIDDENEQSVDPAFMWPYGQDTIDGYTVIFPLRIVHFWEAVINPMLDNFPGCRYGKLLAIGNNRIYLSDQCETKEEIDDVQVDDLYNFDLLSLVGVRYVVSTHELASRHLTMVETSSIECPQEYLDCWHYYIYENQSALPSFFTVSDIKEIWSEYGDLQATSRASIPKLLTTGFVDGEDVQGILPADTKQGQGEIRLNESSSDVMVFSSNLTTPQVLVVNVTFTRNWEVRIDGETSSAFPVDYLLTGIYVPAGAHQIELRYASAYEFVIDKVFASFFRQGNMRDILAMRRVYGANNFPVEDITIQ